jgi:hypothetical protein
MLPGLQNLVAIVSALATSCIVAYVFEKSPSVFFDRRAHRNNELSEPQPFDASVFVESEEGQRRRPPISR